MHGVNDFQNEVPPSFQETYADYGLQVTVFLIIFSILI